MENAECSPQEDKVSRVSWSVDFRESATLLSSVRLRVHRPDLRRGDIIAWERVRKRGETVKYRRTFLGGRLRQLKLVPGGLLTESTCDHVTGEKRTHTLFLVLCLETRTSECPRRVAAVTSIPHQVSVQFSGEVTRRIGKAEWLPSPSGRKRDQRKK